MLRTMIGVWVAVAALLSGCAQTPGASAPVDRTPNAVVKAGIQRHALVIGNGRYGVYADLPNATNDAQSIAGALKAAGYRLHGGRALTDLTGEQMLQAVVAFSQEASAAGGMAFVYYAGHGIQFEGQNFLLPIDANVKTTADLRAQTLDVQSLLNALATDRLEVKVVVLDACRDVPFDAPAGGGATARAASAAPTDQRLRSVNPGLSSIVAPPGTLLAYSTAPGGVALDGPAGGNSPYAEALVQAMSRPDLRFNDLFIAVRNITRAKTKGVQTPWETSSLTRAATFGGPIAVGSTTAPAATPPDAPAPLSSALTSDWDGRYEAIVDCGPAGDSPAFQWGYWVDVIGGQGKFGREQREYIRNALSIYQDGRLEVRGSYLWETEKQISYDGEMRRGTSTARGLRGPRTCTLTMRYIAPLDAPRENWPAGVPRDANPLDSADLIAAHSEKTWIFTGGGREFMRSNGRGEIRRYADGVEVSRNTFTWRIRGNTACHSASGQCWKLYRKGEAYFLVTSDDVLKGRFRVVDGEQFL